MTRKGFFLTSPPSSLRASSGSNNPDTQLSPGFRDSFAARALGTLALVLSFTAGYGCVGNPLVLNVEEDEGAIFCTFQHYRYPGDDTGTLRSSDDGITWNRIYPGDDGRDAVFVCRCRAGLLAELDDDSWYRSIDRGESWQPVRGLEGSIRAGPTHRGDSEQIYLATTTGVFRSTDGGASWTPTETVGMMHSHVHAVAATPSAVFVVAEDIPWWTMGSPMGWGFYRSIDGGRTWVDITGNLPPYFMEQYRKQYGPSCAATGTTVIAWASSTVSSDRRPYRSDDNGNTWTRAMDTTVVGVFESDTSLLASAFFPKDRECAMLLSTDAGRTWSAHGSSPPPGCQHVHAYPGGKGLFTPFFKESPDGTFSRSRDGGRTWEKVTLTGY